MQQINFKNRKGKPELQKGVASLAISAGLSFLLYKEVAMKTIIRIAIRDAHFGDAGAEYPSGVNCHNGSVFAQRHNLRYGNGVIFAIKGKESELIDLLQKENLPAHVDGYSWNVTEASDCIAGKVINGNYRLLENYNPDGIRCEEVSPRPGYKRRRKNLTIRIEDPDYELRGVYS